MPHGAITCLPSGTGEWLLKKTGEVIFHEDNESQTKHMAPPQFAYSIGIFIKTTTWKLTPEKQLYFRDHPWAKNYFWINVFMNI